MEATYTIIIVFILVLLNRLAVIFFLTKTVQKICQVLSLGASEQLYSACPAVLLI